MLMLAVGLGVADYLKRTEAQEVLKPYRDGEAVYSVVGILLAPHGGGRPPFAALHRPPPEANDPDRRHTTGDPGRDRSLTSCPKNSRSLEGLQEFRVIWDR